VEEGQRILAICAITLGVVLLLLVFAVMHRRHLGNLSRQISDLPPSPEGTERIIARVDEKSDEVLDAVEGARMQISSTGDELRAQGRTLRDRIDALISTIAKFVRGVP
jgi:Na+-transporting methylmalonyl-CoA/oxaloacetate decarboxylase gamma subunit